MFINIDYVDYMYDCLSCITGNRHYFEENWYFYWIANKLNRGRKHSNKRRIWTNSNFPPLSWNSIPPLLVFDECACAEDIVRKHYDARNLKILQTRIQIWFNLTMIFVMYFCYSYSNMVINIQTLCTVWKLHLKLLLYTRFIYS